ncbi:hypothetical protein AVEN_134767-1 [Araneus ventricosus]|uniref:RNase H type-1 domain-containing protein n=1 Tax=Araneus ventricosus TaxID=182803 RepID=A0A4Y2G9A2_ARAVE|nr:hypothetical protein AVEN_134767-1 [Araneus ventricosus]
MKATGWFTHPSEHLKPNQISFEDGEAYIARKDIINIFTDSSKSEHGVGAAFCVLTNDIWAYQWSAKLNDNNTVFQAELYSIYTVSWHMRKPVPNVEQEWLKRVANNFVSRQKIRGIIKFISENRDLFRLP